MSIIRSIGERLLSQIYDFDGMTLTEAIKMTFERRGTRLTPKIEAFFLTPYIIWRHFVRSKVLKKPARRRKPWSIKEKTACVWRKNCIYD